jgi:hypothetical protein
MHLAEEEAKTEEPAAEEPAAEEPAAEEEAAEEFPLVAGIPTANPDTIPKYADAAAPTQEELTKFAEY